MSSIKLLCKQMSDLTITTKPTCSMAERYREIQSGFRNLYRSILKSHFEKPQSKDQLRSNYTLLEKLIEDSCVDPNCYLDLQTQNEQQKQKRTFQELDLELPLLSFHRPSSEHEIFMSESDAKRKKEISRSLLRNLEGRMEKDIYPFSDSHSSSSSAQTYRKIQSQFLNLYSSIPKSSFDPDKSKDKISSNLKLLKKLIERSESDPLSYLNLETHKKHKEEEKHFEELDLELPLLSFNSSSSNPPIFISDSDARRKKEILRSLLKNLEEGIDMYVYTCFDLMSLDPKNSKRYFIKEHLTLPRKTHFFVLQRMFDVQYDFKKMLGSGAYGWVANVVSKTHSFALKYNGVKFNQVRDTKDQGSDWKKTQASLKQEALMYLQLNHPNLASVEAIYYDENKSPRLLLECIEGNTFKESIRETAISLPNVVWIEWLTQIANGCAHIHSRGITHKDLKSENIMIEKKSKKVKILDFGLASISSHDLFRSGSPKYMAPELKQEKGPYSNKTDVWSFGILAYETLTQGHFPYDFEKGESTEEFLLRVSLVTYNLEANKQVLMKKLSPEIKKKVKEMDPKELLRDLIVKCLHGNPQKRPTMEEISLELTRIKHEYSEVSSCTIS